MSPQEITIPQGPDRRRMLNVIAQRRYRQRKRERLQSLESKLSAMLGGTNAAYATGSGLQPQYQMQPLLLGEGTPVTPDDSFRDLNQNLITGVSDTACTCLGPHELGCKGSEASSSPGESHADVNTIWAYGYTSRSATWTSDAQLCAELQDLETLQFTFPSDRAMDIPTLKTMDMSLRVASMLGLTDEFLDLTVFRVFDTSRLTIPLEDLPENLRPTEAQLLLPHNPVVDVLPWPSLRTKLVCLFNQPDHLRPPIARGPMAIMGLIQGLDDESEGARVTSLSGNGYNEKSWEVGQAVFKDWWWALDPEIVSNSNRLRRLRGAPKLQLSTT
ncbi:hypothetical protein FB567DRAFT_182189 [Paraphoma chrysanthemicola]|uniref:BZIP domain-containing protein n=1 Tax=Paraphoma chrysanthemicola TaxID=798071 RepID=A0A8K0VTP4_9PLEO|nr:hypothetical protein FB567DRAFT_182189 [Paraphoma chrysanthemicola]